MYQELLNLLTSYLYGWKPLIDCYEWVSSVSWDEPEVQNNPEFREMLGRMELLTTEIIEGLRPVDEFEQEAKNIIALKTGTAFGVLGTPTLIYASTSDSVEVCSRATLPEFTMPPGATPAAAATA